MGNLENIGATSENAGDFARKYLKYIAELLHQVNADDVAAFVTELENAREAGNTVFVVGNGGSAATATHIANDFGMDVFKKGSYSQPFRLMALTDNNALMTAIANDDGYENLFVNQLRLHYRKGDKLVAISASGNSPNVVKAVNWVKEQGGRTIGMVGFDGGQLRQLCDLTILVQTAKGEYGPVEDVHVVLSHLVACWLQRKKK
jgi:D-sedoheptulose 7-phosphate isomerase